MQIDYNGYNCDTFLVIIYFSLIKVLKSNKKNLALTFLYCVGQEARLDDS